MGASENAGPENDGLEFDGPEQHAVMSLVQKHMHTLKTVPIPYVGILILKL